jgi:hypothetical protein
VREIVELRGDDPMAGARDLSREADQARLVDAGRSGRPGREESRVQTRMRAYRCGPRSVPCRHGIVWSLSAIATVVHEATLWAVPCIPAALTTNAAPRTYGRERAATASPASAPTMMTVRRGERMCGR